MRILQPIIFIISTVTCIALACMSYVVHNKCIDVTALERYEPGKATILLDCHGNEWARFELDRRKVVPIERIPQHVIQAFLAAEDWHFYEHRGISFKGIVRSLVANIYHGRVVQGASTITQQLVRLLFFDYKRTFTRKIKEQLVSLLIEMQFSKDQILETYLNHVYFGCGIYGVEAAARRFWGKSIEEVTIGQAAVLAGIMRSPRTYCPLLDPLAAQKRRNLVLYNMKRLEFITKEQFDEATDQPLELVVPQHKICGLHAREAIRQLLERLLGDRLYTGGYTVQTTVDPDVQRKAERSFKGQMEVIQRTINSAVDGALLTVAVDTGEIRALIGGFDYTVSKFNRAFQAKRQLGSVLKPLIFAAALRQGMRFTDVRCDEPITLVDAYGTSWQPNNYDLKFNGPVTLAFALSRSNNIIAIKTFLEIGAGPVITLAKKAHLPLPLHTYASLSLGCIDVTLEEAVGMFNIFANNGVYVQPHLVKWVKDQWGNKIYRHSAIREQVLEPHISGQVLKVMGVGLNRVRTIQPQKRWIDCEAASKTGTTNDWRTCWFMGSTPELTTGVYVGRDDNCSMGRSIYPLHTAFPIWIGLHHELSTKKRSFTYDPTLREIYIDERTGKQVAPKKDKHTIAIYV